MIMRKSEFDRMIKRLHRQVGQLKRYKKEDFRKMNKAEKELLEFGLTKEQIKNLKNMGEK